MLYLNSAGKKESIKFGWFNFNKCCIWIGESIETANPSRSNLTLTSVVFELNISPYVGKIPINLTLTSVVFEFGFTLWS